MLYTSRISNSHRKDGPACHCFGETVMPADDIAQLKIEKSDKITSPHRRRKKPLIIALLVLLRETDPHRRVAAPPWQQHPARLGG